MENQDSRYRDKNEKKLATCNDQSFIIKVILYYILQTGPILGEKHRPPQMEIEASLDGMMQSDIIG